MPAERWVAYDFAVVRVVPHVHLGAFIPVGVVLHARTAEFVRARVLTESSELRARVADIDAEMLARYLRSYQTISEGDPDGGPVALSPPSERFHWLTAPRSDVIQSSAVHGGLCDDPARELDDLFAKYVSGRTA